MATLTLSQALIGAFGLSKAKTGKAAALSRSVYPVTAPLLKNSVEAGSFERAFFTVPAKGEMDRLLRIARRMLDAGRQLRREARLHGRELTPTELRLTTLTSASIRVFEEIVTLSRLNKGRVFPSYDHLAKATSLGRATIARCLQILEQVGFLARQRRYKRIEANGPGPRYAQTSNAYKPLLPQSLLRYVPRWMRPAPIPVDHAERKMAERLNCQLMQTDPTTSDRGHTYRDRPLDAALAQLEAALSANERESHFEPLSLPKSFILEQRLKK